MHFQDRSECASNLLPRALKNHVVRLLQDLCPFCRWFVLFCYALFKVSTIIKVGYIFHGTYSAKNWLNSISKSNHGETHWSKLNFLFNIFLYLMLRLPQCDHQKSLKKSIVSTRFFSIKVNFKTFGLLNATVSVITGNNLLYRNKG